MKGVSKREAPNENAVKANTTLSDNISLFQALRVLQDDDGVEEDDAQQTSVRKYHLHFRFFCINFLIPNLQPFTGLHDSAETCMKTTMFSALAAILCTLLCILFGLLFVAYAKLRYRSVKDASYFDAYVGHKGQID